MVDSSRTRHLKIPTRFSLKNLQMKNLKIYTILKQIFFPNKGPNGKKDGWGGDYIEVIFDNKTKLHCDLSTYGIIEARTVHIEKKCNLMENEPGK